MKRGRPSEKKIIKNKSIHFLLDEVRWNALKEIAQIKGMSASAIIRNLIDEFLETNNIKYNELLKDVLEKEMK